MKRPTLFSMLFILTLLAGALPVALAQGPATPPVPAPVKAPDIVVPTATPPPPGAIVINFDDVSAPCGFNETVALRDAYAGLGVLFTGPAALDGGGILDQCSSFGVSGYSPPNFLAFNQDSYFSDGGIPRPPETITFISGANYVQVNAGSSSGAGQLVTMEAFDAADNYLGNASLILAPTLDTLSITANDIAYVVIDSPAHFVLDDLAFLETPAPDIVVDPLTLHAELCPDETTVMIVNICNDGSAPLDWVLNEWVGTPPTARVGPTPPERTAAERRIELSLGAAPGPAASVVTHPPAIDAPVNLVLDDGSAENYIGLNDGTYGYQFLWLNRFTPDPADFPFALTQIDVLFGATSVPLGGAADLVVYQDTDGDGDPADATWLATYNVAVQANDGATWSSYTLNTPLLLTGPGDVLIGVINRYQESGVEPSDFPAALDQTASQQRSWVAAWSTDPPNPAVLPPDAGGLWGLIDAWFPGNWMIRGYSYGADVPWLSEDPVGGSLPPGECVDVAVTFDSTGLTPGDYLANLSIISNDPDSPEIVVPVSLTVQVCEYPIFLPIVLRGAP